MQSTPVAARPHCRSGARRQTGRRDGARACSRRFSIACSIVSTRDWSRAHWTRFCRTARAACWADGRRGSTASWTWLTGAPWCGWRWVARRAGIAPGRRASGAVPIRCRCSRCSWPMRYRWGASRDPMGRPVGQGDCCTGRGGIIVTARAGTSPSIMIWAMISTAYGWTRTCIIPVPYSSILRIESKAWSARSSARWTPCWIGWTCATGRRCWKSDAAGAASPSRRWSAAPSDMMG